jgi:hypothetical protein
VRLCLHNPLEHWSGAFTALPTDTPEQVSLLATIACQRPANRTGAFLAPAERGPVVFWSSPGGVSTVTVVGNLCRDATRRWLHLLVTPKALGAATASLLAAYLLKTSGPDPGHAWRSQPVRHLSFLGRGFPAGDAVQRQLDWLHTTAKLLVAQGAAPVPPPARSRGRHGEAEASRFHSNLQVNLRRAAAGDEHMVSAPLSIMRAHGLRT